MQAVITKDKRQTTNDKPLTVALAGNPNAGKTTLFNALTGLRQKVANYAGVTVERKEGAWRVGDKTARLLDLPGLYSLEASSLDEQIARDALTGKIVDLPQPDVIVAAVDATNLERHLYLVTQLLEYKIPMVVALTMIDEAERQDLAIDAKILAENLGVPVVAVTVKTGRGLKELQTQVLRQAREIYQPLDFPFFAHNILSARSTANTQILARYAWIARVVSDAVLDKHENELSAPLFSEKLDRVLTSKIFGPIILTAVLLLVFQTIFSFATLPMDLLDKAFGWLGDLTRHNLPAGLLTDLLADGVIAGVGGVLVFLPQIMLLFFFISILEDTGYMARAAFLMDRLMRGVGLHGKAFVPLLSSFACAIPGIMATRTIENRKDRLATIMIAPLMSCSARLPVYTLMIGAFFGGQYFFGFLSVGAVLILAMYILGIVTAIAVAFVLKRTMLKSPTPPLVMELPPYRMPNWKTVFFNVFQNAWEFVKRAGTVILAITIILWALANFPRLPENHAITTPLEISQSDSTQTDDDAAKQAETERQNEQLRYSFAGRLGRVIEPAIKPLGYDWKIGIGLISSFAAREVFVSTMSVLYNVGKVEKGDAASESLLDAMRDARRDDGTKVWSPLLALTTMIFYLLAFQCASTFATVRRETNSWAWSIFMVVYMTGLAYVVTLITYQTGKFLGF